MIIGDGQAQSERVLVLVQCHLIGTSKLSAQSANVLQRQHCSQLLVVIEGTASFAHHLPGLLCTGHTCIPRPTVIRCSEILKSMCILPEHSTRSSSDFSPSTTRYATDARNHALVVHLELLRFHGITTAACQSFVDLRHRIRELFPID